MEYGQGLAGATEDRAELPPSELHGNGYGESPVDLPPAIAPLPHPLLWTSVVLASAAVTLTLLNAHAIRGWAYQLPTSPTSARAVAAAEAWYAATARLGLNRPVETMHQWWRAAEARRFDEKQANEKED
jgi:hypothetical protein